MQTTPIVCTQSNLAINHLLGRSIMESCSDSPGPRDMGQERTLLKPKNLDYPISFRHGILVTCMCGVIFKGLGFLENQMHLILRLYF